MNIKHDVQVLNSYWAVNMPTMVTLLVTLLLWNGCAMHKAMIDASNIDSAKAILLRDSAWKYAWVELDKKKASIYYDSLFKSKFVLKKDYYNAGQVAAELGQYAKCISLWTKMRKVNNDDEYDYTYYLPNLVDLQEYREGLIHAKGFKKLWSHYQEFPLDPRLSHEDAILAKKINLMFIADQTVRYDYRDSPNEKNSKLWIQCDSINAKIVDSIIVNRGIISSKEFGYKPSLDFCILFVHLPDTLLRKHMWLIEKAFKNKGITKTNYALIKDRSLVYEKKGQLYGTQLKFDTVIKKNSFFPIWHVERVDKRRKKVGLTELKYYAEQFKALLPKGYK